MKKSKSQLFGESMGEKLCIIGEFKNEYEERFILYYIDYPVLKNIIFITGDKFNWEEGYVFNGQSAYKPFMLNSEETTKAVNIFNKRKK